MIPKEGEIVRGFPIYIVKKSMTFSKQHLCFQGAQSFLTAPKEFYFM